MREEMLKRVVKRLSEMAMSAGDGSDLSKMHIRLYREHLYHEFKNDPSTESGGYKKHVKKMTNYTAYAILDHDNEEAKLLYKIDNRKAGYRGINFTHQEQTHVERQKEFSQPAWTHTYEHFKSSNVPLVSSDIQSDQGKKLWSHMTKQAIVDGHHVYYRHNQDYTKLNSENVNEYLDKYHGDTISHENKDIVLSKKELTFDKNSV